MNRFAHVIFSDDIRHELGNKQSLIGIYEGKMFVPTFPIVLPKLCVTVWAVTPIDKPFKALRLQLLSGENVLVDQPLPVESLQALVEPASPDNPKVISARASLQISPYQVEGPVTLRLRIQTEEEDLKAGALAIELAAQNPGPVVLEPTPRPEQNRLG
jgi:hypothetical protein